jgi:hypothetical protein
MKKGRNANLGRFNFSETNLTGFASAAGTGIAIPACILRTASRHGETEICRGVEFKEPIHPCRLAAAAIRCSALTFYLFGNESGAANSRY